MTEFSGLKLAQPILRAIADEGYTNPTPIQAKSIPPLLEGRDLLGVAQTGTGKTAAFALPLLQRLGKNAGKPHSRHPQALILAPTRELATQIGDAIKTYGRQLRLRSAVVFGGTSIRPQIKSMIHGVHIVIATPGRLIDLMNQGFVQLDQIETFILDEADRMLDMGFIHDVRKITAALPKHRQTVFFSATMPKTVSGLADTLLLNPVKVAVTPEATTAEKVKQRVFYVAKDKKRDLLTHLMADEHIKRVLIFTRTKHRADRITRHLQRGGIEAAAIHGNKAQNARQRALKGFREGAIRALVATDIAARGIDVDGVTHVINFELPNEPESYVHRIGRTARAGATGMAFSMCDPEEFAYLKDIEKTIRQNIKVITDQPFHHQDVEDNPKKPEKRQQRQRRRGAPQANRRNTQNNRPKRQRRRNSRTKQAVGAR